MWLNQGATAARSQEEHWEEEAPTGCKQWLLLEGVSTDAAKASKAAVLSNLCDIFKLKEQSTSLQTSVSGQHVVN